MISPLARRFAVVVLTAASACAGSSTAAAQTSRAGSGIQDPPAAGSGRAGAGSQPVPASKPAPVPAPSLARHQDAVKLVRSVYAGYYANKTPKDKLALANKLLVLADEERGESKFAILTEARDLAAGAGDAPLAMEAIDALEEGFTSFDPEAMRLAALAASEKGASEPSQFAAIAEAYLERSDAALAVAELASAVKAATAAEAPAKRSGDADLATWAAQRKKDLKALQPQFAGLDAARAKLATVPDDPAANLLAGRYLCLVAGDWENGLWNLSKGSDALLRDAALQDVRAEGTPASREAVGDAWAAVVEKQTVKLMRSRAQARAAHWYRLALPDLAGLKKTRVEKRLAAIGPTAADGGGAAVDGRPARGTSQRLVDEVVRAVPAGLRPRGGADWNPRALNNWCLTQWNRFELDATLTVQLVRETGAGDRYLTLWFEWDAPVTIDGVAFQVSCSVKSTNAAQWPALLKLQVGDRVRVRGRVRELYLTKPQGSALRPTFKDVPVLFSALLDDAASVTPARR